MKDGAAARPSFHFHISGRKVMRKFDSYPIWINHPGVWEETRQRQRDYFVERGDYKMMSWLDYTGKRIYEITEDSTPGAIEIAYENLVYQQLKVISRTRLGRLLLGSLDPNIKYWILPLDPIDRLDCECGAYTFPGHPREGGGIRIYYNPTDFNSPEKRWIGSDDILFHELVHAYRNGSVGYDVVNAAASMKGNTNAEEFFALQMQNVYLACRGATRFYQTYNKLESVSKGTAYQYLAGEPEAGRVLRHFVQSDMLAAKVARWTETPDSFNPFRDHAVLERLSQSRGVLALT